MQMDVIVSQTGGAGQLGAQSVLLHQLNDFVSLFVSRGGQFFTNGRV